MHRSETLGEAGIGSLGSGFGACLKVSDLLDHELVEQSMRTEGRAKHERDARMLAIQAIAGGGEVAKHVDTRRQKVGDHQNAFRASIDAAITRFLDPRLGQLQKARLDDRVVTALGEPPGHCDQVLVRGGVTTAVRDQKNRDLGFSASHGHSDVQTKELF